MSKWTWKGSTGREDAGRRNRSQVQKATDDREFVWLLKKKKKEIPFCLKHGGVMDEARELSKRQIMGLLSHITVCWLCPADSGGDIKGCWAHESYSQILTLEKAPQKKVWIGEQCGKQNWQTFVILCMLLCDNKTNIQLCNFPFTHINWMSGTNCVSICSAFTQTICPMQNASTTWINLFKSHLFFPCLTC